MKTKANFLFLWIFLLLINSGFAQAPQKFNYQAVVRDDAQNIVSEQAVGIRISILQESVDGTVVYSETHTPTTNAFGLVTLEIGGGTVVSGDLSTVDWGNHTYFIKVEMDPSGGTTYTEMGTSQVLSVPYALHSKTAANVFSGDYSDLINTPINVSSFTNDAEYLTDFTESDPIFGIHVSSGILSSDTTNWNAAFGWGDHSAAGYLKSYTETDPLFSAWDKDFADLTNKPTAISDFSLDANSQNITNLANPVNLQDAVTKDYVDILIEEIEYLKVLAGIESVSDIDGNTYNAIKIGKQVWIAENLKTTRYNDGTAIPLVTDNTAWSNLTTPGYCWYDNDSATYGQTYGALYNWYTVNNGNLCPTGWHVPTDADWTILITYLGGESDAARKLKETGTTHWPSPNTEATNETRFTALPGGWHHSDGTWSYIGSAGNWWSATEESTTDAYQRLIVNNNYYVFRGSINKQFGLSVRCVRDYVSEFLTSETDPVYGSSVASGISASDTINWNNKLDSYTETDPTFSNSQATNITASDIINLGNLSGVNTGDQDLNGLATKTALGDSTAQVRSEIPDVSGFLTTETDPSVPSGTQTGQMQYWNGSEWITVAAGSEGQVLTFSGGVPTWKTPLADGEVENPTTGKIWMDRNLGASQVATSSTDAASYGDLYQWGRAADGHESRTSSTTSIFAESDTPGHGDFLTVVFIPYHWRYSQNNNLCQGVSGTNHPCPSGYRLPTEAEWEAECASWGSNNAAGAFASPLKLPVAGNRSNSGSLNYVGSYGYYWSSTVDGPASRCQSFSGSTNRVSLFRAAGLSVRCIKD